MNQTTIEQAHLFLIFILNGILIGIVFDIFRILRKSFNTPNIVTYIEDILFWFIAALIVLYSLFVFNNGEIRGFIFIGLVCGIILYMLFFSKLVVKISVKIILFLKKIILALLNPIIKFVKFIIDSVIKVYKATINMVKKCQKLPKKKKKFKNKEGI